MNDKDRLGLVLYGFKTLNDYEESTFAVFRYFVSFLCASPAITFQKGEKKLVSWLLLSFRI